jgi:hypothetical protein
MAEASSRTDRSAASQPAALPGRSLLELGGFGLLAYGIYNLLSVLISGGSGPEVVLARIGQLVALFPVLFLAPVLIFSNSASKGWEDGLWRKSLRWLVLVLGVTYLLFVPISFLNQFTILKTDANVVQRLETSLRNRKQEILAAVAEARDAETFRRTLSRFPEISNVKISQIDSPADVRRGISSGIDLGIRQQLDQLRSQQNSRRDALGASVRQTALGSLVCGITMVALASRLLAWLTPAGQALGFTVGGITNGLMVLPRQLGRSLSTSILRMQRGFQRWAHQRQMRRSLSKNRKASRPR